MSKYRYVAKDMNGAVVNGVMEANDERDVRSHLRQRDFYATSITAVHEMRSSRFRKKIRRDEIAVFAEQLAVMIDAGLPLVRCLATLARQNKSEQLRQIIDATRQDVENGVSLGDSLSKHPKVFSNLFVSLVRAGEVGGVLDKVLRQLSNYLDKEQQTRQTVKSALVYPKIVTVLCVLTAIFMVSFVVPRFATLYDKLRIELPLPTRLLIGLSDLVQEYWWIVLMGITGIILAYKKFSVSNVGREILDRVKLHVPVFGDLNRKAAVARFVRVLGALDTSGVPILQSLEVSEPIVDNVVVSRIIGEVYANVSAGGNLESPLSANKIFPDMVVQMIAMGEEAGKLGEALEKSAEYLERELDATVKRLIARLEPTLTILVAVMVGLFALAIYLPLFDLISGMSGQ
jgi:type IV pilus assembly protein PilC